MDKTQPTDDTLRGLRSQLRTLRDQFDNEGLPAMAATLQAMDDTLGEDFGAGTEV